MRSFDKRPGWLIGAAIVCRSADQTSADRLTLAARLNVKGRFVRQKLLNSRVQNAVMLVPNRQRHAWQAGVRSSWNDVLAALPGVLFKRRTAFVLVLVLIPAMLFVRRPDQFYSPQLCAEDGTVFFSQAQRRNPGHREALCGLFAPCPASDCGRWRMG